MARLSTDVVATRLRRRKKEIEDELQRVEEYHKKPSLLYRFLLETVIRITFVGSVAAVIAGLFFAFGEFTPLSVLLGSISGRSHHHPGGGRRPECDEQAPQLRSVQKHCSRRARASRTA